MSINKFSSKSRVIFSIFIGTVLEWYDFSIFAFFTPIIAELFFPTSSKVAAYISIYAVFAVGFLVRPLGAIVFGFYGDRYGRKKVLVFSMVVMSISTVAIGLLPTYDKIGILAPITLVILRLIQGFSVGGETTGSASFILESFSEKNRGMLGSLVWSAVGVGMLISSCITTLIIHIFNNDNLHAFGWRIPFVLGIFTGIIGYYFRRKFTETEMFVAARREGHITSLSSFGVITKNKKNVLIIMGLYCLSAMITYLIFIFMPYYASTVVNIPRATANMVTTIAIACITFLVPLAGCLSDRLGRKPCLYIGSLGLLVVSVPLYIYMSSTKTLASFVFSQGVFILFATIYQGTLTAAAQELTNTPVRYTVTSIGYNFSYALFGGTAPFFVTYTLSVVDNKAIPGLYLAMGAIIAIISVSKMRETSKTALA
ncbi:MAG: MFS transporter [Tatlockia sp.]|nr:MFS transporter [Tatlockia sp.]